MSGHNPFDTTKNIQEPYDYKNIRKTSTETFPRNSPRTESRSKTADPFLEANSRIGYHTESNNPLIQKNSNYSDSDTKFEMKDINLLNDLGKMLDPNTFKNSSNSLDFKASYSFLFCRELLLSIFVILLIGRFHVYDCADHLRDISLRNNIETWRYINYTDTFDPWGVYFSQDASYFFELINNIMFGLGKDPSHYPASYIYPVPISRFENWGDLNAVLGGNTNATEIYKKIDNYLKYDYYASQEELYEKGNVIVDHHKYRLSDFVLPLTGQVIYFTRIVSPLQFEYKFMNAAGINSTKREYGLINSLRTDDFTVLNVDFTYNSETESYFLYFSPFVTVEKLLDNVNSVLGYGYRLFSLNLKSAS